MSATLPESTVEPLAASVNGRPGRLMVTPGAVAVLMAGGAAAVYGLLLRVWLLAHLPLFGDEAVVGLMARSIDSGHFSAFYWGQRYGGLEPYLAALVLPVGGQGPAALNATPALLSAVAAVLVAGVTLVACRNRLLAIAAGCTAWVWPYALVWESVREVGFRYAALCCGLAAVLCCVRLYRQHAGTVTFGLLGLALGLGWWASPEIAYFALPCLVLLVGWWRASSQPVPEGADEPRRGRSLAWVVAGAFVGSLPWWLANVYTGFASLRGGALPANGGMGFGAKLSVFFHEMLPMQLGVRTVLTGAWVGGPAVGQTLYAILVVLIVAAVARAVWLCVRVPAELVPLALALGVAAFPFLYAAAPGTAYWVDGRYGLYLPALVVALFAVVVAPRPLPADTAVAASETRTARPSPAARLALGIAALGVLGATCLTVGAAHAGGVPASPSFFRGWRDADSSMREVVSAMRAHHIDAAYADYWTAYSLDFIGHNRPLVSPSVLDVNRSTAIATGVAAAKDPAWLFFSPRALAQAAAQFSNPQLGPGPYTEQTFEQRLTQRGIAYRVVPLGILDAIVPAHRVRVP